MLILRSLKTLTVHDSCLTYIFDTPQSDPCSQPGILVVSQLVHVVRCALLPPITAGALLQPLTGPPDNQQINMTTSKASTQAQVFPGKGLGFISMSIRCFCLFYQSMTDCE